MKSPFMPNLTGTGPGLMYLDSTREAEIVAELDAACLRDGLLQPMPADFYAARPQNDISLWCVRRGFYCLPTVELVEWLGAKIGPTTLAIEIGAGNGALGRALGIPRTDSRMQEREEIVGHYMSVGQACVAYADDVEQLTALQAVEKYRPRVVLASWVTHRYNPDNPKRGGNMYGVDEGRILDKEFVDRYVFVGHERVHGAKPILSRRHQTYRLPFLFSRAMDSKNVIWIWG